MSGGHFDYNQHHINDIAMEIESIIENNNNKDIDEYGQTIGYFYPDEIIKKFKDAVFYLKMAEIYAQRVDWLISGDDGEEQFLSRLKEDQLKLVEKFQVGIRSSI